MIPNPYPGIFIVFEGIDGCGKTVQLEMAAAWLRSFTQPGLSENMIISLPTFNVALAKEPGKERFFGKKIYADLANRDPSALHKKNPHGFQAWHACNSKENLQLNVIPALKAGSVVLCDRFRTSTIYSAQTPEEIPAFMTINREIIGEHFIWPDLILIFDLAVATAIGRLKKKNRGLDEYEKLEVLRRVRLNYLSLARMYPNCEVVDGEKPEEAVFERVKSLILPVCETRKTPHIV